VTARQYLIPLAIVVYVGLAIRISYLEHARQTPGYTWEDPDGYMGQALKLAQYGAGWRWTFEAVTYDIEGRRHALPPGYSIFLSAFALGPGFPRSAQLAQILLAGVTMVLMFALGRLVHTAAAGLLAAAAYALWVPNIFNVWSTSQETVYLPLILFAFLLYARAATAADETGAAGRTRVSDTYRFAAAGAVFGLAALTRSMPLFFVLPAALVHLWLADDRRRAGWQAAALLAAFTLVTAPYSVALSRHFGHLAIIDTHGSIHQEVAAGRQAPGMFETGAALGQQMLTRPLEFAGECVSRARTLFYVNGGRILQVYVVADTKLDAAETKTLVHAGSDLPLVLAVVLAPLGAALARERRAAMHWVLWAAVNIGIASLGGFGGARLRAPFEPFLLLFAAIVLTGGWRRPTRAGLAVAVAAAIAGAAAVLPQVARSLRSWPDYGVTWPSIFSRAEGYMRGTAGLNVAPSNGFAVLNLTLLSQDNLWGGGPVKTEVRARGVLVHSEVMPPWGKRTIRIPWPRGELAFVEISAMREGGRVDVLLTMPR
jgi:hypothetical protein